LLPRSGKALAVADGEGRNGIWLAEQGLDVLSIDFSPSAQQKARALAKQRGVTLTITQVDVHTWDYPAATFDVVVEIFTQFSTPAERAQKWAGMRGALALALAGLHRVNMAGALFDHCKTGSATDQQKRALLLNDLYSLGAVVIHSQRSSIFLFFLRCDSRFELLRCRAVLGLDPHSTGNGCTSVTSYISLVLRARLIYRSSSARFALLPQ